MGGRRVASGSLGDRPAASEEIARCIIRLATVRRELRALETEEQLLREALERSLGTWPGEWFPIQVDAHELRRHARMGSLDVEAARAVLAEAGLLASAPTAMQVVSDHAARQFPGQLEGLGLSKKAAGLVRQLFADAVAPVPDLTAAWVGSQHAAGRLDEDRWRQCFRRGQPLIWVWAVR